MPFLRNIVIFRHKLRKDSPHCRDMMYRLREKTKKQPEWIHYQSGSQLFLADKRGKNAR